MKLYIPACGDRLTLSSSWEFDLYLEHRNVAFAKVHKLVPETMSEWGGYVEGPDGSSLRCVRASLPAGAVLECDRIYIRSFNKSRVSLDEDYDSVTWKVIGKNGKAARHQRFWVKLPSCYDVEYEDLLLYRDAVKLPKLIMES